LSDRFEFDSNPLGAGTYGVVLRATSKSNKAQKFAVKVFRSDDDGMEEWNHEARLYKELELTEDKGFVQLHEQGLDVFPRHLPGFDPLRPTRPYLLLTLVEGVTGVQLLSEVAKHSWKTLLWAFARLADRVCYVHRRGYIFRDLKPANVIFDLSNKDDPKAYFVDLGFVYRIVPGSRKRQSFMATMPYASPDVVALWALEERRLSQNLDQVSPEKEDVLALRVASDAWALGMVFLEALLMKTTKRHIHVALGESESHPERAYDYVHYVFAAMRFQDSEGQRMRERWRKFLRLVVPDAPKAHVEDPDFRTLSEFLQRLFTYEPRTPNLQVAELEWFALLAKSIPRPTSSFSATEFSEPLSRLTFEELESKSSVDLSCPETYVESPSCKPSQDSPAPAKPLPKLVNSVGEVGTSRSRPLASSIHLETNSAFQRKFALSNPRKRSAQRYNRSSDCSARVLTNRAQKRRLSVR
jgi:serine/threonine protein kinase